MEVVVEASGILDTPRHCSGRCPLQSHNSPHNGGKALKGSTTAAVRSGPFSIASLHGTAATDC